MNEEYIAMKIGELSDAERAAVCVLMKGSIGVFRDAMDAITQEWTEENSEELLIAVISMETHLAAFRHAMGGKFVMPDALRESYYHTTLDALIDTAKELAEESGK